MLEPTPKLAMPLVLSRVKRKPTDEGRCGSTLRLELGQKPVAPGYQCSTDLVTEVRAPRG